MFTILVIILILLFYYYDRKQFTYWTNLGIPQLEQTFLLGTIKDVILQRKPIAEFYVSQCRKLSSAPIIGIYFSYRPIIVINDFELAKNISAKDFYYFHDRGAYINSLNDPLSENLFFLPGERWKRLRQKLTPLFSSSKLKMMLPIIKESVDILDNFIEKKTLGKSGFTADIRDLSSRFTLTMISSIAFGTQNDSINEPYNIFNLMSLKVLDQNFVNNLRILAAIFLPKVCKTFKITLFDKEVSRFFLDITERTIGYREDNKIYRNDFLQLLMSLKNGGLGDDSFTLNEVTANLFIFVIAGHETTSATIAYCLYEIARNPLIKQKIQKEIHKLKDEELSYEKLEKLKYLENCINETLRKYPPIPVLIRECQKDYKVSNTSQVIPKGTMTIIPVYSLQRDPKLYENPLKFNPDRFDNQETKILTFGYGNRSCIGARMSMIVIKTCLLMLLSKYDIESIGTKDEIEFSPKIPSLVPKENIFIKFYNKN